MGFIFVIIFVIFAGWLTWKIISAIVDWLFYGINSKKVSIENITFEVNKTDESAEKPKIENSDEQVRE
jgi:hypothetical protein